MLTGCRLNYHKKEIHHLTSFKKYNMSHFTNDRVSLKFKNSVLFYSKKVLLYGTVNSFWIYASFVNLIIGHVTLTTTLQKNCLFHIFKLTRNASKSKHIYSLFICLKCWNLCCSWTRINNCKNKFLKLNKGPADDIIDKVGSTETKFSINFM